MIEKRKFVCRKSYLDDFDEFVNASSSNLDGQVLLIIGDEGMGKTALLQAMAHRAATQKHYVALGEINKYQSAFFEQIYPFIAQRNEDAVIQHTKEESLRASAAIP